MDGPGRGMPVFIDQGGYHRCCGDVLIAVRCGGNFCSNKGTRRHRPIRFRSASAAIPWFSLPPSTSVERRPMLVHERKAILRRESRIRLRERVVSAHPAEAGDRAQEHFLREFPPLAGNTAALYCALAGEVPTARIRHAYLASGVRLYYPRVTGRGTLAFYPHREG